MCVIKWKRANSSSFLFYCNFRTELKKKRKLSEAKQSKAKKTLLPVETSVVICEHHITITFVNGFAFGQHQWCDTKTTKNSHLYLFSCTKWNKCFDGTMFSSTLNNAHSMPKSCIIAMVCGFSSFFFFLCSLNWLFPKHGHSFHLSLWLFGWNKHF